jgi:ABC-type Mn2+/Zn2+ transport system ATPase subunit
MHNFELKTSSFLPSLGCELSFDLPEGSAVVIVGDNGVGKTTLLNHLHSKYEAKSLSFAEQKPLDFFYDYSLAQIRELQSDIDTYWADFGLTHKLDRRISLLSGGEAQSLKLASALASPHDLFILDEPSQALDNEKKNKLSQLLVNMMKAKKSFLIVEHDLLWLPKNLPVLKLGRVGDAIKVVDQWTT